MHAESKEKIGNLLENKLGGLRELEERLARYVAVPFCAGKIPGDVHSILNSSLECEVTQQPHTSWQIAPVILHTLLCSALRMCLASQISGR